MVTPQISAIICTHNRDSYLGPAIDSLLTQDFPGHFEVIVVDNASTDHTRDVVEARLSNPHLRYSYEPVTGLSVARNTGANLAQSPLLAYLDDDAVADPHWLAELWKAYQAEEKLAVAGGKVTLIWPPDFSAPPWLSDGLAGNLGAYDLGDQVISINNPSLTPRGVNYSIRRSFWQAIGGFNVNLGRVGKNLLSNEELHTTELALKQGWQVAYLPHALVAHHVAPERLKPSWFLARGWWQGISECYREKLKGYQGAGQLKQGTERMIRGLYKSVKFIGDPAQRFENIVYAYGQIGYLTTVIKGLLVKS